MNRHLLALITVYLLLALAYSVLVPPWEAPDESAHYLVVEHMAREGEMPSFERSYEAVQPPGYYLLAGAVFRVVEGADSRLTQRRRPSLTPRSDYTRYGWTAQNYRFQWAMQILRWLNATLGAVALFFIFHAAQQLLEGAQPRPSPGSASPSGGPSPLAVVALVALTPQFLHNVTAVNNDALANACGALLFWMLVDSAMRPPGPWRLGLGALAATVLPFVVKLTVLPMSAALLIVLGWRAWRTRRVLFLAIVAISIAVLSVAMMLAAPASARFLLRTLWWRLTFIRPNITEGWSLAQILSYYGAGYWGQIGWKFAALPAWLWSSLWAGAFLGAVASLRLLLASWRERRFWRWLFSVAALLTASGMLAQAWGDWWQLRWVVPVAGWAILVLAWLRMRVQDVPRSLSVPGAAWRAVWLAAGLAFVVVTRNALTTPQFQARFLFPALGPIVVITVVGWWILLPAVGKKWLTPAILVAFVALNLFFWFDTVIPLFFQPLLDG